MQAAQQRGPTCGAHCAVNSQTPHDVSTGARLRALRRVLQTWVNMNAQGEVTDEQAGGAGVSVGMMHAAAPIGITSA